MGGTLKSRSLAEYNGQLIQETKGLIFYGIAQAHSSECSNLKQVTYFLLHLSPFIIIFPLLI